MSKIIFMILFAFFLVAQSDQSENLKVLEITEEQQVLIKDYDTGEEWLALEGDEIKGWVITSVKENQVVIWKEAYGNMQDAIVKKLTMPNKLKVKLRQPE